jgi:DNA-binding response OmpR family regulator
VPASAQNSVLQDDCCLPTELDDHGPLVVEECARLLQALGAETRIFDPHDLPLPDGASFLALGPRPTIDLALIDLRLRGENGLTLAIRIRETLDIPVVMLTGRGDEMDKIIGLETGADDYMMKPFNPRELIARLRAVLRRVGHPGVLPTDRSASKIYAFGQLRLDQTRR